jgi:hypothetical protein
MAIISLSFYLGTPAYGIILHPDAEPNLTTWTDRPVNAVVGRWSYNASFVAVSPKWIITTRHQGTSPSTVDINGVTYNCIYNPVWIGGPPGNVDIRLIRLKNLDGSDPNLAYAPLYTNTNEVNQRIIIGGYGRGRETILTSFGTTYGYTWGTGVNYNNNTQRWCTNIITEITTAIGAGYTSDGIKATFDNHGTKFPKTQYEGTPAEYDSGGGWFIKVGTVWNMAGLTHGVSFHGASLAVAESWFDQNPAQPTSPWPDIMDAVRISSYAAWINAIIAADCNSPVQGDLNGDCRVDFFDFAVFANQWLRTDCASGNNFCNGADFQPDANVNFFDLLIFAQNWLVNKSLSLPQ